MKGCRKEIASSLALVVDVKGIGNGDPKGLLEVRVGCVVDKRRYPRKGAV